MVGQWTVSFASELNPFHTSIYLFSWGNGKAAPLSTHLHICLIPDRAVPREDRFMPCQCLPACPGTRRVHVVKTQIMGTLHMTFHLFKLANPLNFDHTGRKGSAKTTSCLRALKWQNGKECSCLHAQELHKRWR